MLSKRAFLAASAALALSGPAFAAAPMIPFTAAAFAAAQKAGKPILVAIHADWCPTCQAQAPIIDKLGAQADFKDFVVFRVDFDAQKDVVRSLGARTQSTLIVFKGAKEVSRTVGSTDKPGIEAMLRAGI